DHGRVRAHLAAREHRHPGHARARHRRPRATHRADARRPDRERCAQFRAGPDFVGYPGAAGRDRPTRRRCRLPMNLRESTGIALGALRANKLRSFLTLLGTIIGVMSVIAVLSFVEGLNRYVSQKLLNAGANVFWVDSYGFVTSQ